MKNENKYVTSLSSKAEDLFVELFCEIYGPDKTKYLSIQHPVVDIRGKNRFIDFALENDNFKVAIEIDGEKYHNPSKISNDKYYDDLLKQNSLIYDNWKVYRWVYAQLKDNKESVKDDLILFLGELPEFRIIEDYLPMQKGKSFELRDHQEEAIKELQLMRQNNESIALLYHATGTGKTVTAVTDAKNFGKKTLFLAHTKELVLQASKVFKDIWPNKKTGLFLGDKKETDCYIICASVQSVSQNLESFNPDQFGYLIIDEAHHGTTNTYKKILNYFNPNFTLGLTATPERSDGEDLLKLFKKTAHKIDLKTAVENNELVPVRCIRVKTNIDISKVKINGITYYSHDLESKLFIPERNKLLVDTYNHYINGKKTLIFCVSIKHAEEIANLFIQNGIQCKSVSGTQSIKERKIILDEYENGKLNVLCACDLLNEGWDSPKTEVLFMARPTLSKTLYTQQLGRGMRKSNGKDYLLVFDFIDNANLFNMPYSIHRLLNINEYRPGGLVLAESSQFEYDNDIWNLGEKPDTLIDIPISTFDMEIIDLFNWQEEVKNMKSQLEFVRMVDVQSETIEKYIRDKKIISDLEIPIGIDRSFKYFKEEKIFSYAKEFKWDIITYSNMKDKFIEMITKMDMSYSYKPVLIKAIFEHVDQNGKVRIEDIVDYFIEFYEDRKSKNITVEKKNSLYCKEEISRKDVERNIFSNPFKRFEDMRFLKRCTDIDYIEINNHIFKNLNPNEIQWIREHCDQKLLEYFNRLI